MNFYDNEAMIIEDFQLEKFQNVFIPYKTEIAIAAFSSIYNKDFWKEWTNSSGKNMPPPDFYCDKFQLMMEVMRIDDHAYVNDKGKIVNPVTQRESLLQKEIREKLKHIKNIENVPILVNAITDLPSEEDHNYHYYLNNFKRVVQKHMKNIPLYRANHPEHLVVFFVFDESSGYVQTVDKTAMKVKKGEFMECYNYVHFCDRRFLEVIANSDIDVLIWYSPYKHYVSNAPFSLPTVLVYDVKNATGEYIQDYPEDLIISTEE